MLRSMARSRNRGRPGKGMAGRTEGIDRGGRERARNGKRGV